MKKLCVLAAIIPLLSFGLKAQKQGATEDRATYYKITESYYDHADSSFNLTEYFDEGFITEIDTDTGRILSIEEHLTTFLTYGDIERIKKPDYAENDSAEYYRYKFDGEVFDDSGPAWVLKDRIEGTYEKYGAWVYFWAFVFTDSSQLQMYTYQASEDIVMDYVNVDSTFFKL